MRQTNRHVTLRRYHGISVEQYDEMLAAQDGRCAICKQSSTQKGRKNLDVDHCHATNRIRGLLCANCNRAIGLIGDSIEKLTAAVEYVKSDRFPHIVRGSLPYKPRPRK